MQGTAGFFQFHHACLAAPSLHDQENRALIPAVLVISLLFLLLLLKLEYVSFLLSRDLLYFNGCLAIKELRKSDLI